MRKSILAALALLPLASPAFATDWYVLDYQHGECVRGDRLDPNLASPAAYETLLRRVGQFRQKQIVRDDDGKIAGGVIGTTSDMAMTFFPSRARCERVRQAARSTTAPSPSRASYSDRPCRSDRSG
jgi:hypothetical protein